MLRGLYTAASGMITEQRKHDTVTNNIANINTPGYKQGYSVSRSFPEMLIAKIRDGSRQGGMPLGKLNTGVYTEEIPAIYTQGDLMETQNSYDFALLSDIRVPNMNFDASGKSRNADGTIVYQPQAYFTVLGQDGEQRFTRDGKFTVDRLGQLVTAGGLRVMDNQNQAITITEPVKLSANGVLTTETGQAVATLKITRMDNPQRLLSDGNGLFRVNPADQNTAAPLTDFTGVQVKQGFIERSNVDSTQAMVDMTTALRAYEANQRVIQFYDKSMEKAVNEVGRV